MYSCTIFSTFYANDYSEISGWMDFILSVQMECRWEGETFIRMIFVGGICACWSETACSRLFGYPSMIRFLDDPLKIYLILLRIFSSFSFLWISNPSVICFWLSSENWVLIWLTYYPQLKASYLVWVISYLTF